jgi:hypothetical protein
LQMRHKKIPTISKFLKSSKSKKNVNRTDSGNHYGENNRY